MPPEMQERDIRQLKESSPDDEAQVSWQGGEPTPLGLEFFKRSVDLAECYRRPGQRVLQTMQSNGTLVDDEWAAFLKANNYLVGISIDGPRAMHDVFRVTKKGAGGFDDVLRGCNILRRHGVDVNILRRINAANAGHPL